MLLDISPLCLHHNVRMMLLRKGIPQILRIDSFAIAGAIGLLGRLDYIT
jgi:hypothetical protein